MIFKIRSEDISTLVGTKIEGGKVQEAFPGFGLEWDEELRFYKEFLEEIRNGNELLTIRYKKGNIRLPHFPPGEYNGMLPVIQTDQHDESYRKKIGYIQVPMIFIDTVKDFPEQLIRLDTYNDREEMIENIQNIYKTKLDLDEVISGYMLGKIIPIEKD